MLWGKNTTLTYKSKGSKAKEKRWALASGDDPFPECSYVPGPGTLLVGQSEDIIAVRIKPKLPTRMGLRPRVSAFSFFPYSCANPQELGSCGGGVRAAWQGQRRSANGAGRAQHVPSLPRLVLPQVCSHSLLIPCTLLRHVINHISAQQKTGSSELPKPRLQAGELALDIKCHLESHNQV